MKSITTFINEAVYGEVSKNGLIKPCNNLIDAFNGIIKRTKTYKRNAILVIISSGAATGESIINNFIDVAAENKIDSFMFSSASDKLVKITDTSALDHQGPHVKMDDVIEAILNDDIDTYDFNTVYVLSDGQHIGSKKTASLINDLIDQDVEIYGFSFGEEKCEITYKLLSDGADYKNALSAYFIKK